MKDHQARELLKKFKEGTLTVHERAQLETWYLKFAKSKDPVFLSEAELEAKLDEVWDALTVVDHKTNENRSLRKKRWQRLSVAAAILVICTLCIYIYKDSFAPAQYALESIDDFLPGDNRAVLTLGDGEKIILNDAKIGALAKVGHTAITKTKEGEITYSLEQRPAIVSEKAEIPVFNKLSTPKGGQYQVQLPDGSRVWLNALSSIRFPSVFSRDERVVEVTGEVYFNVAKVTDKGKNIPFKVIVGDQTIEVLGTQFNITSYKDEKMIETTLLEGSIKVNVGKGKAKEILLKPGQQIQVNHHEGNVGSETEVPYTIRGVDTESIVSWKDGFFRFDNTNLTDLMRQISRWYDVEVVYEGPVTEYEFMGKIERSAKLSKVLKILELGGVHFRMDGKKLIVM